MKDKASVACAAGAVAVIAALSVVGVPGAVAATPRFSAAMILNGASLGLTQPDDIAAVGSHLFVGFQNGVASDGGDGTGHSTLVEFTKSGAVENRWNITGKIDGMGADVAHNRVIVTVNEDGNSSMIVVDLTGAVRYYRYDLNPLPHGGGTDAVSIFNGQIYTSASNPGGGPAPALYRITLAGNGIAHVHTTGLRTDSNATTANPGGGSTQLALTDPDSNTVVPANGARFAGDFMLDAQGDQQAIFAHALGEGSKFHALNLDQSIDDTAFATDTVGSLVITDSTHDAVELVTGPFVAGAAYSSVTPCNANNAPTICTAPNYLATLNLNDGTTTPLTITGDRVAAKGAIFVP